MDEIAYNSQGESYIVDASTSVRFDSEARHIMIRNFKREGMTDYAIRKRLRTIRDMMMDADIAQSHPDPRVREAVQERIDLSSPLTDEDYDEIVAMTHNYVTPTLSLHQSTSPAYDPNNSAYALDDLASADPVDDLGLRVVKPSHLKTPVLSK